jgi:hypothetical protein
MASRMSSTGRMGRTGPKISLISDNEQVSEQNSKSRSGVDIPLEECVVLLDVPIDCRDDASCLLVEISAHYDLRGGFGHYVSETLKVTIGNDA